MSYANVVVDINQKLKIKLIGWPTNLPFQNPYRFGSLDDLRRIVHAYKTGELYWVHLTPAEIKTMKANWQTKEKKATCSDTGGKHQSVKGKAAVKKSATTAKKAHKRKTSIDENEPNKCTRSGDSVYKSKAVIGSETDEESDE